MFRLGQSINAKHPLHSHLDIVLNRQVFFSICWARNCWSSRMLRLGTRANKGQDPISSPPSPIPAPWSSTKISTTPPTCPPPPQRPVTTSPIRTKPYQLAASLNCNRAWPFRPRRYLKCVFAREVLSANSQTLRDALEISRRAVQKLWVIIDDGRLTGG